MKFHVHTISAYNARCNRVSLSFLDITAIPADFTFTLFVPATVEVKADTDCDLPYFVCKNIWGHSAPYILKDLAKAAKKSVHHRAEKEPARVAAEQAFWDAQALNVEEAVPEFGEFFGNKGDQTIVALTLDRVLYSKEGSYSGIWRHNGHGWEHPSYCKLTWRATDDQGHVFIFTTSNDGFNYGLQDAAKAGKPILLKAEVVGHNVFRGERQTVLFIRKQSITTMPQEQE